MIGIEVGWHLPCPKNQVPSAGEGLVRLHGEAPNPAHPAVRPRARTARSWVDPPLPKKCADLILRWFKRQE